MSETHVVSALRAKRAEVSAYIHDLEKKIRHQRANLAHVDAVLRLFAPELDPSAIPPKRRYRRSRYFPPGDLSRRCLEALRDANGAPVTASAITGTVMAAGRLSPDDAALRRAVGNSVLLALGNLKRRGAVTKTGTTRDALWRLSERPLQLPRPSLS